MDVLIVEDHPLYRETLRRIALGLDDAVHIEWTASARNATRRVEALEFFDIALIDLSLPDASGLVVVEALKRLCPERPVAVFAERVDKPVVSNSVACGACAVIPKAAPAAIVDPILRLVRAGGVYIPAELADLGPVTEMATPKPRPGHLTPRQNEVLALLSHGLSNRAIAAELGLKEGTVKVHVTTILRALNVRNRTEAAAWARKCCSSQDHAGRGALAQGGYRP